MHNRLPSDQFEADGFHTRTPGRGESACMRRMHRTARERHMIPEDVRRFILLNIPSVPHLEALLLLRNLPMQPCSGRTVAQRLYISEMRALDVLAHLRGIGLLSRAANDSCSYLYAPVNDDLRRLVDSLAGTYAKILIGISNLIHSAAEKKPVASMM
jgi:hypothetical protein